MQQTDPHEGNFAYVAPRRGDIRVTA